MVEHLLVWQDPVALALLRSALVLFATLWAPVANVCQRPGSTNGFRLISVLGNELWTCELYWIVMFNPDWRPWRMCSQRSSRAVPTSTSSHIIPAVTTHSCHRKVFSHTRSSWARCLLHAVQAWVILKCDDRAGSVSFPEALVLGQWVWVYVCFFGLRRLNPGNIGKPRRSKQSLHHGCATSICVRWWMYRAPGAMFGPQHV